MKTIKEQLQSIIDSYKETQSLCIEGIKVKEGYISKYKKSIEAEEKRIVEIKTEIENNKKDIIKLEKIIEQMAEKWYRIMPYKNKEDRQRYYESLDTHNDPICSKNCLDVCVQYNNTWHFYVDML